MEEEVEGRAGHMLQAERWKERVVMEKKEEERKMEAVDEGREQKGRRESWSMRIFRGEEREQKRRY